MTKDLLNPSPLGIPPIQIGSPKFVILAARSDTNFKIRTTSNFMILVSLFEPDIRDRICRRCARTSVRGTKI